MPLTLALVLFELVVMVLSISLHDSAQAWMANRLGDPTGRMMGRITPGAQLLAAIVALLILVVLRFTQRDATFSLVIASQLAQRNLAVPMNNLPAIFPLYLFLYFCILVNLLLFVFNLIPLPFLDGGKILMHYLPYNAAKTYEGLSMWMMIAFFFVGFGVIMAFFAPLMSLFNRLLFTL
jgi:Zn-dependent protease